jgi:hypothetical protein
MWLLTLQLFKNSIDTQGKLKLNLHSLSVSEILKYRRKCVYQRHADVIPATFLVCSAPVNKPYKVHLGTLKWSKIPYDRL